MTNQNGSGRLALTAGMGTKRGRGRGSFIDSVLSASDAFYADVLQHLKAWSAAPPKLRHPGPTPADAESEEATTVPSADGFHDEPAGEAPTASSTP
jgi:hypothetical protein